MEPLPTTRPTIPTRGNRLGFASLPSPGGPLCDSSTYLLDTASGPTLLMLSLATPYADQGQPLTGHRQFVPGGAAG
jgi:hypothetical protein